MYGPYQQRRAATIWTALGVTFGALALITLGALVLPELVGIGPCDGICNGAIGGAGALGVILATACALAAVGAMIHAVQIAPVGIAIPTDNVIAPGAPVIAREVEAAQALAEPDVFTRWIRCDP